MSDGVLLCGNRHGDDEYNDKRKRMMADKKKDGDSGRIVMDRCTQLSSKTRNNSVLKGTQATDLRTWIITDIESSHHYGITEMSDSVVLLFSDDWLLV